MVDINNLNVIFNIATPLEKKVLNNFDLHINDNDFISILGSNGAGKSTLFNSILGKNLYTGDIKLDDNNLNNLKEYKRSKLISIVYQDPARNTSPNLSIYENIILANKSKIKNKKEFKEKIRKDLKEYGLGLENELDKKCKFLSGGERQVLSLYMAESSNKKLLLLDEHTAALDPSTSLKVMEITNDIVKKKNITTLMITHNLKMALNYGNRLIILNNGKIVLDISGKEKEEMTEEKLLKTYSNSFSDVTLLNN